MRDSIRKAQKFRIRKEDSDPLTLLSVAPKLGHLWTGFEDQLHALLERPLWLLSRVWLEGNRLETRVCCSSEVIGPDDSTELVDWVEGDKV